MARTDSFFIRATVPSNGTDFAQAAVDLGAYVDALGKSVLRIHNISVQYGAPLESYAGGVDTSGSAYFQLTTQSQTQAVDIANRSVIASGSLAIATGAAIVEMMDSSLDVGPQHWTDGYLVAVEQLYLGVDQTFNFVNSVSIVLELSLIHI